MEAFKQNGSYWIDCALKSLAIAALVLFIICSLSWLVQRPNRYQLMVEGGVLIRLDTITGRAEYLLPDLKPYDIKTTEELEEKTIVEKIKNFLGIGSKPKTEDKKPKKKEDLKFLPHQPPKIVDPDKK